MEMPKSISFIAKHINTRSSTVQPQMQLENVLVYAKKRFGCVQHSSRLFDVYVDIMTCKWNEMQPPILNAMTPDDGLAGWLAGCEKSFK